MRLQLLISSLASSAALLVSAGSVQANSASSVQDFANQMGSWNVITSGAFSTDSHVHGAVAVGGSAKLSGNAEINSHGNSNAEALRVYGNLNLIGNTTVLSGGATLVKNSTINKSISLLQGQPNSNQSTITDSKNKGSLTFNGNGSNGVAPSLKSISTADSFFTSRDSVMQAANTQLLAAGTFAPKVSNGNTLSFGATTAGVSVFNWDIDQLTSISQVGFNFVTDSFIVVNIIGDTASSVWNASFNVLQGSDYLAQHVLWNIGVSTVNLTGDQLLGSILAPDSTIKSYKQLNGSIYAGSLEQHGQEIHYSTPTVKNVPEEASTLVIAFAALAMGAAVWARRIFRASAR